MQVEEEFEFDEFIEDFDITNSIEANFSDGNDLPYNDLVVNYKNGKVIFEYDDGRDEGEAAEEDGTDEEEETPEEKKFNHTSEIIEEEKEPYSFNGLKIIVGLGLLLYAGWSFFTESGTSFILTIALAVIGAYALLSELFSFLASSTTKSDKEPSTYERPYDPDEKDTRKKVD